MLLPLLRHIDLGQIYVCYVIIDALNVLDLLIPNVQLAEICFIYGRITLYVMMSAQVASTKDLI